MQPWSIEVGQPYLIETLTFYFTGRIASITATDIVIDEAAKVFDTDRLSKVLAKGKGGGPQGYFESEYLGDGHVIRQAVIVAFTPWPHKLPHTVEYRS